MRQSKSSFGFIVDALPEETAAPSGRISASSLLGHARFRPVTLPLCDREPGEVDRACGNDLDTDAEKQERRQAGNDPSPFLSDELGNPIGVAVAE